MNRTPILVAAAAAALALGGAAGAAGAPRVSVSVAGAHGTSSARCGRDVDSSAVVRRGVRITISGRVSPTPLRAWHVRVRVQRCVAGKFRPIWARSVLGRATGAFSVAYLATTPGVFIAKAKYGLKPIVDSNNVHFVVR
jgi:hypothetical protein